MSSKISKGGKEARLNEGGGGGPETMPAHTQTRRAEDKHTDRQTSADNIALGFQAPWILLPPSSRFTLPNGVPCSPDLGSGEELSFPQSRLPSSASAGLSLTPAGRLERLIRSPLYRKLSSAPDTFLLPRRASDLPWASLSCLSTGAIIYHSPLSCKHSPPGQGIPDEPPNVLSDVQIPEREERRLPRQCNLQKRNLLLTQARAPAASITEVQGQRAPSPSCYPNL